MSEATLKNKQQINPSRVKGIEFIQRAYFATAEAGTPFDALLDPGYWSHAAAQFTPYTKITAICEDGSFYAELLVISCDRTWAKVVPLIHKPLTTADVSLTESGRAPEFEIYWRGPQLKFAVKRKADSAVIKDGLQTRDEADAWLKDYVKVIA